MRFILDIVGWAAFFILLMSGAARAALDGAFFAYFRPQLEAFIETLPEFIKWMI